MAKQRTTKAKPRPPRLHQSRIEGTEPERIKELDDAAAIYYDAMQDRLPFTKAEDEAKENLLQKMIERKTELYENDDFKVSITDTKKVTCKRKKEPETNGQE